MAKDPLSSAVTKWQQRFSQYAPIAPSNIIREVAQRDVQRVAQGGTALNDLEAALAVRAAAGNPTILDPKRRPGLGAVPGNAVQDIEHLVTGFLPAVLNFAHHLPSETTNTVRAFTDPQYAAAQGYEVGDKRHGLGSALRNVARLPLSPLLPGVHTAAGLTTQQGRSDLATHPVSAALDVLPIAGRLLHAGSAVAGVAGEGTRAAGVLEAASEGKPLKTIYRAIPSASIWDPATRAGIIGKLADNLGLSSRLKELAYRPMARLSRTDVEFPLHRLMADVHATIGKMSETEIAALFRQAQGLEKISPDNAALIHQLSQINDASVIQPGLKTGNLYKITVDGKDYTYQHNHPVVRAYESMVRSLDRGDMKRALSLHKEFLQRFSLHAPPAFKDFVDSNVQKGMEESLHKQFFGEQLSSKMRQLATSHTVKDFYNVVGSDEANMILRDAMSSWQRLADNNLHPLLMTKLTPDNLRTYINTRLTPKLFTPETWSYNKTRAFDFSPGVHDISIGVTQTALEALRYQGTQHFISQYVAPHTTTLDSARESISRAIDTSETVQGGRVSTANHVDSELAQKYWNYDPATGNVTHVDLRNPDSLVIDKNFGKALQQLMGKENRLPLRGAWDRSMRVFKLSVLTGPRHMAHVAFGGAMMLGLRDPMALREIVSAAKSIRDGTIPEEVLSGQGIINADHMWSYASGKTLGRMFGQAEGGIQHFEDFLANTLRASEYLSKMKSGFDHEAAMSAISKIFIDMDGMSPFERTAIRQVFPFYAFTKHVMQYVLTYPSDHPFRAAILSRLSNQYEADWKSGLPTKFMTLFHIGHTDSKGNILTVDYRTLNPFRSLANGFTLTGFMSMLNPAMQGMMEAAGLNTLSGSAEIYPTLVYDSNTGSLVAKRQDTGPKLIEAFIPQLASIDAMVGFTDRMRSLKKYGAPGSFQRELFASLNLPFPTSRLNLPQAMQRAELNRYKVAQGETSSLLSNRGGGDISRFNLVPYAGRLVDPANLQGLVASVEKAKPGVAPKSVIRRPKSPRRSRA